MLNTLDVYYSAIKQKALHLQGFLFNEVRFNC